MPKKEKVTGKNPDRRKPGHYNAILIEDLKSDFRAVIETVQGSEKRVEGKIEEVKTDLSQAIDDTRTALGMVEKRLTQRMDEHSNILLQHGEKLDRLELKLDKVAEKVERHDHDIEELKQVASSR